MYFTKNKAPVILMALLLLIVCLPVMSMAEGTVKYYAQICQHSLGLKPVKQ